MDAVKWILLPLLFLIASVIILYTQSNHEVQNQSDGCSLLPHSRYRIRSTRIVTPEGVISGLLEIRGGLIAAVVEGGGGGGEGPVLDYGDSVVMPGLIDVHAHLDEPGRADWEGFYTGTKAAAAGGVTTLIDMPLNSFPSTVSEQTLRLKIKAARDKLYVDVGFWGGLVPENAFNQTVLEKLLDAGALGLKSFMCPSGINDFPMTNATHIKEGLYTLAKYKRPLLVHAEMQLDSEDDNNETNDDVSDPRSYSTYLKTRPPSWEEAAIRELHSVAYETRTGGRAEGAHIHIVHLSDSQASLNIIKDAKTSGSSVTVETCPHYLAFSSEQIPYGDTRFKCSPPIRNEVNRMNLWQALMDGHIDFLSSDHSPSLPELKLLDDGDFLKAWGGISSLQFVLPITWSYGKKFGITLNQLAKWWSERPAKLSGQELKGAIVSGNHADLVIWDSDVEYELDENHDVHHKHRNISAYMGTKLFGKVISTFVRGSLVYNNGKHAAMACRDPILAT
ncbi:Allantoinase [Zostera marina]|uniref:allantoinase n=1 Tax=Zostera marina TaxID=29655 RepID=A0A0K9PJS3_ZOSMR|nr:Allantoinase [Zostera marina]